MKIVIDIPEEAYNLIVKKIDTANIDLYSTLINATENCTPLPKGHGRLLDEKVIIENAVKGLNGIYDLTDMPDYIAGLPAIIPAESEKRE